MNDPAIEPAGMPVDSDPPQIDGRTREGRAIREAQAAQGRPQRNAPRRVPSREPARDARGNIVVVGRDGETLSRRRKDDGKDIFDIPEELKEPGWSYQWCAVSINGNSDILLDQNLMFAENGWRAVPASRWEGRFMPRGHKGPIIRGQQMLMERPESLTREAEEENYRKAAQQIRDRDAQLLGRKANLKGSMGPGFEVRKGTNYKGRQTRMSIDMDEALAAPRPQHELAQPGE